MSVNLSPIGNGVAFLDSQGVVLKSGKIYTYVAGSTTPSATYTDSTQTVPNANPIILGSDGKSSTQIWLVSGNKYKFIITDSSDNQIGPPLDNISGINDVNNNPSEWLASGLVPTYVSATQFTVLGNQTNVFTKNRRVQVSVLAGTLYGSVISSSYSSGTTSVVVSMDSGSLDNGLSSVNVSFLNSPSPSIPAQYSPNQIVSTVAALRSVDKTKSNSARANGYYSGDGVVSEYYYDSSDTSSGCLFTGSVSGTVLTVSAVTNGTLAVGQAVNRSDTGATIGYISSLGTGSGGAGTYNLNASATVSSMTMSSDNGGTYLVAFDGGRWKLSWPIYLSDRNFGAKLDDSTDDTYPIQNWLTAGAGRAIYSSKGTAKITAQLTCSAATRIVGDGNALSIWKKYFNGDLFSVTGNYVRMEAMRLDGNGASGYTGGCLNLGAGSFSFEAIACSFVNSIDCPIIFSSRESEQHFTDCEMYAYSSHTVYCARVTSADSTSTPADRHFTSCYTGGGLFVDFSGMVTSFVNGCFGSTWKSDANSRKIIMGGCRFTIHQELGDPDFTLFGQEHVIVGNSFEATNANSISADSTCSNVRWQNNSVIMNGSITQIRDLTTSGNANPNIIDTLLESYTPVWNGATTGPVTIGNGSIAGNFSRTGRTCECVIDITKGTTTTVPTGAWTFQLPWKARVDSIGTAQIILSTGVVHNLLFIISGGSNVGKLWAEGASVPVDQTTYSLSGTVLITIKFSFNIAFS